MTGSAARRWTGGSLALKQYTQHGAPTVNIAFTSNNSGSSGGHN